MNEDNTKALSKVIRIDESEIRGHLDKMVRGTVEEALNAMLDAVADEMCNAQRYERSPDRVDARAGHYTRKLHTKAGEVEGRLTTTTHHPELMMEKNSKERRLPQYQAPISAVWIMSFFNKIKNFQVYPAIEFLE